MQKHLNFLIQADFGVSSKLPFTVLGILKMFSISILYKFTIIAKHFV